MALGVFGAIFLFFVALRLPAAHDRKRGGLFGRRRKNGRSRGPGRHRLLQKDHRESARIPDNPAVKAIVLRVDSPGGGVGPSQEIYEELKKTARSSRWWFPWVRWRLRGLLHRRPGAEDLCQSRHHYRQHRRPAGVRQSRGAVRQDRFKVQGHQERRAQGHGFTHPHHASRGKTPAAGIYRQCPFPVRAGGGRERPLDEEKVRALADGGYFPATGPEGGTGRRTGHLQDAIGYAAGLAGIKGEPKIIYPPRQLWACGSFSWIRGKAV